MRRLDRGISEPEWRSGFNAALEPFELGAEQATQLTRRVRDANRRYFSARARQQEKPALSQQNRRDQRLAVQLRQTSAALTALLDRPDDLWAVDQQSLPTRIAATRQLLEELATALEYGSRQLGTAWRKKLSLREKPGLSRGFVAELLALLEEAIGRQRFAALTFQKCSPELTLLKAAAAQVADPSHNQVSALTEKSLIDHARAIAHSWRDSEAKSLPRLQGF